MEQFAVETVAGDGKCGNFLLNVSWVAHYEEQKNPFFSVVGFCN
jgi:hypothetical protein